MLFSIITIFPEFFDSPLACGLISKAREKGLLNFKCLYLRDFSTNKHRNVDDRPYGGGPGMVMTVDPLRRAVQSLSPKARVIMLSPKGRPLTQELARELAGEEEIALVCGRYEGIDARFEELCPVELVSVGDFVLNGGESAALCLIESVSRLLPEFMGTEESVDEESFSTGLLEYPHYTRPDEYEGRTVPEILSSGHHERIATWRREKSLDATLALRPDLLSTAELTDADIAYLKSQNRRKIGRNLYLALVHSPVENKSGQTITTSLTNLDLHDISRVSCSYGLGGYFVCTPIPDQKELAQTLIDHWRTGYGQTANPDRSRALETVQVLDFLGDAIARIAEQTGKRPRVLTSSAKAGNMSCAQARAWLEHEAVLLVLGTGHGLSAEVSSQADGCLRAIRFLDSYNHLSVRSAAAILVDRLLGDIG